MKKRLLIICQMYHRWIQEQLGFPIEVDQLSRDSFSVYRIAFYQQHRDSVKAGTKNDANPELNKWNKSLKVARNDYINLKDPAFFTCWKEEITTTAKSHNLMNTLVAPAHIPNRDLDQAQCKWMYKTLKDKAVNAKARAIVLCFQETHDSCGAWQALCEHFDDGIIATILAQKISAYLLTVRLESSNWRH